MTASELPPPAASPPQTAPPGPPSAEGTSVVAPVADTAVPGPPPSDWGAVPVGASGGAPARSGNSVAWSVAALVGCILSMVGTFLPLLSVGDRSISRSDGRGIDMVAPWKFRDRYTGSLLFERWDIAFALLLFGVIAAVLLLAARRQAWPAVAGALLAAVAFHQQLSMVQRAEMYAIQRIESPTYLAGGILTVAGAFLALVGFVAVLARRH